MKNKSFDIVLFLSVIVMVIFGIIMIYSSSSIWASYKFNDSFKYVKSQTIFFVIGIFLMFYISKIDYKFYKKKSNLLLFLCFILLILVLIPGIGKVRNGARSWFGIGPLGIQPSEATKIALIIFVAKYLSNNKKEIRSIKKGVFPILGIILLFFALIMLEPDFGTGMVMVLTLVVMLFVSGVNVSFFVKSGLIGLVGIIGLIIAAPYRLKRIVSFVNPWKDPL